MVNYITDIMIKNHVACLLTELMCFINNTKNDSETNGCFKEV